jgi:hypothetical protein
MVMDWCVSLERITVALLSVTTQHGDRADTKSANATGLVTVFLAAPVPQAFLVKYNIS